MGTWSVVLPEWTINIFTDPQFGLPDPDTQWAIAGPNAPPDDVTRSTATQFYGTGSALFTMAGASLDLTETITVLNEPYTMTWLIRRAAGGVVTDAIAQAHFDTANVNWTSITHVRNGWYRCVHTATATAGARAFGVHCLESGLQGDGAQLERLGYRTTYCDGEQLGCEWLGGRHASISQRSALETRGGTRVDLQNYELYVRDSLGAGMAPVQNVVQRYGQQPGGVHKRQDVLPRTLTLVGAVIGADRAGLHAYRESLIDALKLDRSPTGLPVRLWYDNGTTQVYIDAQYDAGLDLGRTTGTGTERIGIRLIADDPNFYQEGEFSTLLDTTDPATLHYITARLKETGQWDDVGLANPPGAGGLIYAIKYNPVDGRVYIGGSFTNFNQTGTGIDYAVAYDPPTDTWIRLGAANAIGATVRAIAIASNGDVYIGGDFVNLGGAAGDHVAYWDISAGAWVPVAGGGVNTVYALAFGLDGTLYIGGSLLNWGGLGANYAVKYPIGGPYTVMDAGNELNNSCTEIATHIDGDIYLVGDFTQFGANVCNYWCRYDLTDYQIVDAGLDAAVQAIAIDGVGAIYLGGSFSLGGGGPADYIVKYERQFIALGVGVNAAVWSINIGPDGLVFAGGAFTAAGGLALANRAAKWNRYAWAHLDVDLPGAPTVHVIETCRPDPVIGQNYDLWLGFDTTGAATLAGSAAITPAGTRTIYPSRILIDRAGGTSARLETIRNETIGRELLFNKDLLDGEEVTIRLEPGHRSMESDFFGKRWETLPASDVADFYLLPQANRITAYVGNVGGGAVVTGYLVYRQAEWSIDD